jgi:hypothetical protein
MVTMRFANYLDSPEIELGESNLSVVKLALNILFPGIVWESGTEFGLNSEWPVVVGHWNGDYFVVLTPSLGEAI